MFEILSILGIFGGEDLNVSCKKTEGSKLICNLKDPKDGKVLASVTGQITKDGKIVAIAEDGPISLTTKLKRYMDSTSDTSRIPEEF